MILSISTYLDYTLAAPSDLLLQIEAAPMADQVLLSAGIGLSPVEHFKRLPGEDGIGDRIWMRATGRLICDYRSRLDINRVTPDLHPILAMPLHALPGEAVRYLFPSRYCPSDEFQTFVTTEFGSLSGGARIAAMRDWITRSFAYSTGSSTSQTTARETFVQRAGICRDFSHMLITLARASAIPARMVSVYAPEIDPMDFHAVVEVWLEGGWYLTDPTGMAHMAQVARIAVGRDAADIAFLTSFGQVTLNALSIRVSADQPATGTASSRSPG
ncbi:MAG: transglutaminase family protein [Rhodobacterales bacterium]|nr:transglutaminase family protein [Rhodobacterales bacterium]